MTKNKKKRNKIYRGKDAAMTQPVVTRMEAADRNKLAQWWFEKKRVARPLIITTLVVIAVVILILQMIRLVSGG
jgi:hypothetical protein